MKSGDFVKTKASSYYGSVKVSDSSDSKKKKKRFNVERVTRSI